MYNAPLRRAIALYKIGILDNASNSPSSLRVGFTEAVMARAMWKGSISFGLVNIPVALYSGQSRSRSLDFTLLDRRDLAPIGYLKVNKKTGEEVPAEEIVKGYEYDEDEFVVLEPDDLKRANVERSQTIEIVGFVNGSEIPATHFEQPYYLEPIGKGAAKSYALLREALARSGKIGIAQIVLHTRQHLAALMSQGNVLILNLLRYPDEIRNPDEIKVPPAAVGDKELQMAQRLVEEMAQAWEPKKYRDEYRADLLAFIEKKAQGGTHAVDVKGADAVRERSSKVVDIMSLLKRSVEAAQKKPRSA